MKPLLIALLLVLAVAPLAAQPEVPSPQGGSQLTETQLERDTRLVSSQLRCVVCQGLSLQDSPSQLAQEMRAQVAAQLASGKTPAEVKAYFVERYGEWVLLQPEAKGFNLVVYLMPVLLLIAGAVFVYFTARKWTRRPEASKPPVEEEELDS